MTYKSLAELMAAQKQQDTLDRIAAALEKAAPVTESPPQRRPPGRPPWTEDRFFEVYRASVANFPPGASDKELAAAAQPGMSTEWFKKLVKRFGRPG